MKAFIISSVAAPALAADSARAADTQSITVDAHGDFGYFDPVSNIELSGIAEQVRVAANEMRATLASPATLSKIAEQSNQWHEQLSLLETEHHPVDSGVSLSQLNMENLMTHKSGIAMAERASQTATALTKNHATFPIKLRGDVRYNLKVGYLI